MRALISGILLIVGLINFFPLVGVVSADQLEGLYGIELDSADLIVLMRHRAVLFGLLGGLILLSAFRPALQLQACVAGLISMVAFIALALVQGGYGPAVHKVVWIDVFATVGLVVVLILRRRPLLTGRD